MPATAVPLPPSTPRGRVDAISSVVPIDEAVKLALLAAAEAPSEGTLSEAIRTAILEQLARGGINQEVADRLMFANDIAGMSGDNVGLMKALDADAEVNSVRDLARTVAPSAIAAMVDAPGEADGGADFTVAEVGATVARHLLTVEPTASLRRLVLDDESLVPDDTTRSHVLEFLDKNADWDMSTMPIHQAVEASDAFDGIPEDHKEAAVEVLEKIQLANARAPTPAAVSALARMNMLTPTTFTRVSQEAFVAATSGVLHPDVAAETHRNGVEAAMLHDQVAMDLMEAGRGAGLQAIDGANTNVQKRFRVLAEAAAKVGVQINLETLFGGGSDLCACDECATVYSPAAYLVDLLNFLRYNNLEAEASADLASKSNALPIEGTVLEKLFRRRPDIGHIELTCANTNVVLPYIDLANEVMESFVDSLGAYAKDAHTPKQATLAAFNADATATTEELVAAPQNVNMRAYDKLLSAVYPAAVLPYHEPMDRIRAFAAKLGIAWLDVLTTFRPAADARLSPAQRRLWPAVLDRAADAEALGLVAEEYVILTKESFWPQDFVDAKSKMSAAEYQTSVGVVPTPRHFGYATEKDLLDDDRGRQTGLMFVKKQLLPRTQIDYETLVQVVETRFVNAWPNSWQPQAKGLDMMRRIRPNYRSLLALVDTSKQSKKAKGRYVDLVDYLIKVGGLQPADANDRDGVLDWIAANFERMGKMVVLDAGQAPPKLPLAGDIFAVLPDGRTEDPAVKLLTSGAIAQLRDDGSIVDASGAVTGQVDDWGLVTQAGASDKRWTDQFVKGKYIAYRLASIKDSPAGIDPSTSVLATATDPPRPVRWVRDWDHGDGGNIDATTLVHLDGTPLTLDEWDRFHRFVRLCKKLGGTVAEVDAAVGAFFSLNASPNSTPDISASLLSQLASFKKLKSMTSLAEHELLAFWSPASRGRKTSPLTELASATIGSAAQDDKITSDHIPALMAGLRMPAHEISSVAKLDGKLDEASISRLQRYAFLARAVDVKIGAVDGLVKMLEPISGSPWRSAGNAVRLLETWDAFKTAGFALNQLLYLFTGEDSAEDPVKPTPAAILDTSAAIMSGVAAINKAHADCDDSDAKTVADSAAVQAKAHLFYSAEIVSKITDFLEGKTTYVTNAPAGLASKLKIPGALVSRLAYAENSPGSAQVTLRGILNSDDARAAEGLLDDATTKATEDEKNAWKAALNRLAKQARTLFGTTMDGAGIFSDTAKQQLLAGDRPASPSASTPTPGPGPSPKREPTLASKVKLGLTSAEKRRVFLDAFIPFLRRKLQRAFVLETMASAAGLADRAIVELLLEKVLVVESKPALEKLLELADQSPAGGAPWVGHLRPSAAGMYTFQVTSESQPAPLLIDGKPYPLAHQCEDPTNVWYGDAVHLSGDRVYPFSSGGSSLDAVSWRTASTTMCPIPQSALLVADTSRFLGGVMEQLVKTALVINSLKLSSREVSHFQAHLGGQALARLTPASLLTLCSYARLRDSLPRTTAEPGGLIALLAWCADGAHEAKGELLAAQISRATGWHEAMVGLLAAGAEDMGLLPASYGDGAKLARLQALVQLTSKIGIDVPRLFAWVTPQMKNQLPRLTQTAAEVEQVLRSKYDAAAAWTSAVQPASDALRQNRQAALVAYLLAQDAIQEQGVADADGLYEFLLIDVQMTSLVQTSRIKQAISTVQLFIQRVLLGLETARSGVPPSRLSAERWKWMQKYVLWEANRKVFLYPENYLEPSLRDNKSQLFQELESGLLAKDVTRESARETLEAYVYRLDQVGNLQPVGLLHSESGRVYVFSRTHAAPYTYYWCFYDPGTASWSAWERIAADIPNCAADDGTAGCYVVPVEWQSRLLLFFAQVVKQAKPPADANKTVYSSDAAKAMSMATSRPSETWSISMGWTEYRGGKWLPKLVSPDPLVVPTVSEFAISVHGAMVHTAAGDADCTVAIEKFVFSPVVTTDPDALSIWASAQMAPSQKALDGFPSQVPALKEAFKKLKFPWLGGFYFSGDHLRTSGPEDVVAAGFHAPTTKFGAIHTQDGKAVVASLAGAISKGTDNKRTLKFAKDAQDVPTVPGVQFDNTATTLGKFQYADPKRQDAFYHTIAPQLIAQLLKSGNIKDVIGLLSGVADGDLAAVYGQDATGVFREQHSPYSLYNWELGFHLPMLLADRLLKSQRFDEAIEMMHYVFNPLGTDVTTDASKAWQFRPFRQTTAQSLKDYFSNFRPGYSQPRVTEWRQKPFDPFVIARGRPLAYMKWAVLKYIDILIQYGDFYLLQNTLESIPMAIQLYVMASHLFGPRGQKIPARKQLQPQTYMSLRDRWDAFSNAMVSIELAFPFSNQTALPPPQGDKTSALPAALGGLFGQASTLYFAIPDNSAQRALGAKIDDRLFKIRHSQDISGVFRRLPLWDPPIDPALLVQAAARGIQPAAVLEEMAGPMPNYRFLYLLGKAFEMCGQLTALSSAFLAAKEKGDAEALGLLRQKHEIAVQSSVMEMKRLALDEAAKSLEALRASRRSPVYRLQHYLRLIGGDPSALPQAEDEFTEIANQIDAPVKGSSLALSPYEDQEQFLSAVASDMQVGVGALETLSGFFFTFPEIQTHVTPLGVGVAAKWGPPNLGHAAGAAARLLKIGADEVAWRSANAGRNASNQKQYQDRVLQANAAGYEIKAIDRQIAAAQVRLDMTRHDLAVQQTAFDQAREVDDFLRHKYSNGQLYAWMEGTARSLFFQTYRVAYGLAKQAERAFAFERPSAAADSDFVRPGAWDGARDGLMAGDQLQLGLRSLEAAYLARRGHDFEITKTVSLCQADPLQLLALRETGACAFEVPELLFDLDFPGHYMRQIRSVAVTIPCVVGPYASVNATLRLEQHRYRVDPAAASPAAYPEQLSPSSPGGAGDARFRTSHVPIASIAVSSAQSDAGVFELDFRGERYLPFEGAGCISSWSLRLPDVRQFDYASLTDVLLHIRYTALDGGEPLRAAAAAHVRKALATAGRVMADAGMSVLLDLRADFATEWFRAAAAAAAGDGETAVVLANLSQRLAVYTPGLKVSVGSVDLLTEAPSAPFTIADKGADGTRTDGGTASFKDAVGVPVGAALFRYPSTMGDGQKLSFSNWEFRGKGSDLAAMSKAWLLVKYTLA